eukprot:12765-Heterococcus_DN1.PRE.2
MMYELIDARACYSSSTVVELSSGAYYHIVLQEAQHLARQTHCDACAVYTVYFSVSVPTEECFAMVATTSAAFGAARTCCCSAKPFA